MNVLELQPSGDADVGERPGEARAGRHQPVHADVVTVEQAGDLADVASVQAEIDLELLPRPPAATARARSAGRSPARRGRFAPVRRSKRNSAAPAEGVMSRSAAER